MGNIETQKAVHSALRHITRAFQQHLDLETKRLNLRHSCPCESDEVAKAYAAIAAAEGKSVETVIEELAV